MKMVIYKQISENYFSGHKLDENSELRPYMDVSFGQ